MQDGVRSDTSGGLSALFAQHRLELARFIKARCADPGEAEDLLQELWLKLATLSMGPVANGRAYLFRMANNLVIDTARGRRRAMARDRDWTDSAGGAGLEIEDRPDPSPPADEVLAREQEAQILRNAIEALPPGARRALILHRFEGLGQAEVAQVMGISRSGVEKHLAVAMRHLRNSLADCGWYKAAASSRHGAGQGGQPPQDDR